MADPTKFGRRTKAMLYDDLREVFSLYDLEIVADDGLWLRNVALEDMMCVYVRPFSVHQPFVKDGRGGEGAKKGVKTKWGAGTSKKL